MQDVARPRLAFLDWTRGLAAVIMLQGHTFHSFVRDDLRTDGPYVITQFLGGLAPAVFLFLTGITFAFSMERSDRMELSWGGRLISALKRGRYLLLLAMLFRLQLWVFSGAQGPWTDLFKVDILNCMGVTMLLLAPLALAGKGQRMRVAAFVGFSIAVISPLMSLGGWDWLPWPVRNYLLPSYNFFSLFPWAAFLALGVASGTVLKSVTAPQMNRVMQWTTILGFVLTFGGQYFSNLPFNVYPSSEFWLNSPWLIAIKFGVVLIIIGLAYLWTEHVVQDRWSWVQQIGKTSLIVYWVHIELVYGRWFGFWKEGLNNYQCGLFAAVLMAAMLGLSILRSRWPSLPLLQWKPAGAFSPGRVSGD